MKTLFNSHIQDNIFKPITDPGVQIVGTGIIAFDFHYEITNLISSEIPNCNTIDSNEFTSNQIVSKHIKKYSKVWESLA